MENFNNIYNENYKWVVGLIRKKTNNAPESEELADDIFLKINENLHKFDENACTTGMAGWIRSFVWNKVIDFYRKKKLDVTSIEDYKDEDGKEIFSFKDSTDIEAEYCTNELIDKAKDVINLLPATYKRIATLFYIKDCTYDEIVEATGLELATIKVQLNRARKKMQLEFGVAQ